MTPFKAGLIAVVVIAIGTYFGFTKANPFSHPYELSAVFERATNVRVHFSPVRIAGVNVGEVSKIEPIGDRGAARVTMKIKDQGLPIHEDAELKIRPRIFLEGNFFIDLRPGTPGSPTLKDGKTIPIQQTATPVQFDQILIALQSDTRSDLQTLLKEYSKALVTGGAKGFNQAIKYWTPAYKNGSLANQASLGTREHDLSSLVRGQQRTFHGLARHEENLKDLVTNFNTTAAAFAREDDALERAIPALDRVLRVGSPALASLNSSLPGLRRFAVDALPGTRSSNPTLKVATPFIKQAALLVREQELKGLARQLRKSIPDLARLNKGTIPLLEENRSLSRCTNQVLLPFANTGIPDPDFPQISGQPFYKQSARGLVGLSGETRITDANGPFIRGLAGGGPNTISLGKLGEDIIAQSPFPIDGVRPDKPDHHPRFRPNVPCETQQPPDLHAPAGSGDATVAKTSMSMKDFKPDAKWKQLVEFMKLQHKGVQAIDPLTLNAAGRRKQAHEYGYKRNSKGVYVMPRKKGRR
jgi:virulence factor Mce-like protein